MLSASRFDRFRRRKKGKDRARRPAPRLEHLEKRQLLAADLDTFLTHQHVDLNLQHEAGQWQLGPLASQDLGEVQYENDQAVLYVGSASVMTVPQVTGYDFLGVAPGESYHVLPQSNDPDTLFLGLSGEGLDATVDRYDASAESKGRLSSESLRWAKATLSEVRHTNPDGSTGTGQFALWALTVFGEPGVFISSYDDGISNPDPVTGLDTTDGITADDAVWVTAGSHAHYNFGFSEPGRYEVDVTLSAYFGDDDLSTPNADGFSQSAPITLYFSVESVGQLQFDSSSYSVDEAAGSASIDVIRTGGSDGRISASYTTNVGTATASSDYTPMSGEIVFLDGETRKSIDIPITDDASAEGDETFNVSLMTPLPMAIDAFRKQVDGDANGLLGDAISTTVTIRSNDEPVSGVVPFALPQVVSTTPDSPVGARLADFDGDGDLDLLVPASGSVSWLPLDGGAFGSGIQVAAVSAEFNGAVAGDLDNDGDQDVILAETGVGLAWYPNDGSGNFGDRQSVAAIAGVSPGFLRVFLADLDGDGDLDAVANSQEAGQITWYANDGAGNFGIAGTLPIDAPFTFGLTFADLDGDGDQDVAAANFPSDTILWAANDGSGNFGSPQTVSSELSGSFSVIAADLDGDADYDLVSSSYDNKVALYENDGSGSFGPQQVLTTAVLTPFALTAADLDGDTNLDLLVGSGANGEVVWLPGNGFAEFQTPRTIALTGGTAVMSTPLVDMDGDGDQDVLAAVSATAVMSIENRTGESATAVFEPAGGTYRTGQFVDVSVYFGSPVTVTGSPSIPATISGEATEFSYVSGSGTNTLTFRFIVPAGATDTDGIELGTMIDPNGGALVDVTNATTTVDGLSIPATDLSDVLIDGVAPLVTSISRTDTNPTTAHLVSFMVEFDQSVSGVDVGDFDVIANGVTDAAVTGVQGSGAMYVVTVGTGTGSGTIRLDVRSQATITNDGGASVGSGFTGGQVYTLNRRPERTISTFYTSEHGDLFADFIDGKWELVLHLDEPAGDYAPQEILTVLGPTSALTAPTGPEWDFLGLGNSDETVFVLPAAPTPGLPFLGLGAERTTPGTFAAYLEDDPRVDMTSRWIRLNMTDVRGPAGGEFSMYSIGSEGPRVWMASSDGIGAEDSYWLREGSHDHTVMAFSVPGIYEIDVVTSGFLDANGNGTLDPGVDPYTESGVTTLYFQVNDSGDPTPVMLRADVLPAGVVPFALPEIVPNAPVGPVSAGLADLDGDDDDDLIVIAAGEVSWLPLENGGFGTARQIASVGGDEAVAGDVDGDGDLDVLIGESGVGLAWYANDGVGNFGPRQAIVDLPDAPAFTISTYLVDIDGDGDLDAAANPQATGGAAWYANDGSGNFGTAQPLPFADPFAFNGVFADFDGDGDQDMAVASFVLNEVRWSANDGSGNFGSIQTVSSEVSQPITVGAADMDGDGDLDFLSAAADSVAWYANDGSGNFGPQQILTSSILLPYRMAVEDLDGDGNVDFVIGGGGTGEVFWMPGSGPGEFDAPRVVTKVDGNAIRSVSLTDLDEDGDKDVVTSVFLGSVSTAENRLGESATAVLPPAAGTYRSGQFVDVGVFFGSPVTVIGLPFVSANVGGNSAEFEYVGGSGTNTLTFRYVVPAGVVDADGIELGTAIDPNGGTLVDVIGETIIGEELSVPAADLSGVMVDGLAPLVSSIARTGENPTAEQLVEFIVEFDRPVTGVDTNDFELTADGVVGAAVANVEGSGAVYVVTVRTGRDTGTIRLDVVPEASVTSSGGSPLGAGFMSGEVYTLNRRPERTISEFYTDNHADLSVNFIDGAWDLSLHLDDPEGIHPTDEIITVVGPLAAETTPGGSEWDFLGASGDSVFVLPNTLVPGLPFLGVGAEETPQGTFAAYRVADTRVNATSRWVQLDLLDVRGPQAGEFSMYSIGIEGPKVWMASSDGIGSDDSYWLREGAHDHPAFAFSAPGLYAVDVVASGFLDANGNGTLDPGVDPYTESGVTTLYFQINESGDPTPVTLPADPLEQRLVGDTDNNGEVNFADFLVLSSNFGKAVDAVWEDGDFDANGSVDFQDFLALSSNFGKMAEEPAPKLAQGRLLVE